MNFDLTAYLVNTDRRHRRDRHSHGHSGRHWGRRTRPPYHRCVTVTRPHSLVRSASQPWVF